MSLINSILREAVEDIAMPSVPGSAAPVTGSPMGEEDFASKAAQATAAISSPDMSIPNMPQGTASGAMTLQKTVMNTEPIQAILKELKGIISTYEKTFAPDATLSPESGAIQITNLLKGLANGAERLAVAGGVSDTGEEELPEAAPEVPEAAPEVPEAAPEVPEAAPEAVAPTPEMGNEELPPLGEIPEVGGAGLTNPNEEEPESEFTNPFETI